MSGRASTTRVAGLATSLARGGLAEVAARLGIADLLGRDAQVVLAAFIEWIVPDGALREQSIARIAAIATLEQLFDQFGVAQNGIDALNAVTPDGVRMVIAASVTNYVDARFQEELVSRIERNAISEQAANQLAGQIREYIEANVQLDLSGIDVMQMNWDGAEGKQFVDSQYLKAYQLLGGAS